MKIIKEITFDMAHMLSGYEGKCANLHGHTYKLQVCLDGMVCEATRMLVDFNLLKRAIADCIVDRFDHAVAFSGEGQRGEAEEQLLRWACEHNMRRFLLPKGKKTTCEDMAVFMRDELLGYINSLNYGEFTVGVRLWETPTSFAEIGYAEV